jgi:hypothetical protein
MRDEKERGQAVPFIPHAYGDTPMADRSTFQAPLWLRMLFFLLAIVGGITLVVGLQSMPERAWANLLLISNYLVGLALGGLALVALHYVTGARWSAPLRRVPEALAAVLPVAGVGLAAVLLCHPALYLWYGRPAAHGEHASALRDAWLNYSFFVARALIYLAIWLAFAFAFVRGRTRAGKIGLSAGFLVAFSVTCWLASSDWLMSLEPDWTSTVFGVYNFAGLFLSALAAVTLVVVALRLGDPLRDVITQNHLHDLGKLVFAFSCFWMYIWFCQYLLIWYTNHPAETVYLRHRAEGSWPSVLLLDLALNWGIPFVVLLPRWTKCRAWTLAPICLVLLVGRWVDLFLIIFPSQGQTLAVPGLAEAGFALGAVGILALAIFRGLSRAPLVPVADA